MKRKSGRPQPADREITGLERVRENLELELKNRGAIGDIGVGELKGTIRAVQKLQWRSPKTVRGKGWTRSKPDGLPLVMGDETWRNPVEYILTALASCMTITLVYKAALHGVKIDEVESTFEGDIDVQGLLETDKNARNGYKLVTALFKVRSNASRKQLESWAKSSPVFNVIANPVPIRVEVQKKKSLATEREAPGNSGRRRLLKRIAAVSHH